MTAQNYTGLQNAVLVGLSQAQPPYNVIPPNFAQLFPQATSYAENRIYRKLTMLGSREVVSGTVTAIPPFRLSSLGRATIIVLERVALVPASAIQYPYEPASLDQLSLFWPDPTVTVAPDSALAANAGRYFAMLDNDLVQFGPIPNMTVKGLFTGLCQPAGISAGNPTTYLSTVYPELLQAGCMVFLTGWLTRNYGAQSDEPRSAVSFESQFQALLDDAENEERRRRGLAPNIPMAAPPPQPAARA